MCDGQFARGDDGGTNATGGLEVPLFDEGEPGSSGQPDAESDLSTTEGGSPYGPLVALFAVAAVLLCKVWLTRYLILGDANPLAGLMFEAAFVLLTLGLVDLFFARWRLNAYLVADVCATVVLLAAVVYASFYDRLMVPAAARLVGQVPSVGASVIQLVRPAYLLYIIDLPVLAYLAFQPDIRARTSGRRFNRVVIAVTAVSAFAAALVAGAALRAPADVDSIAAARSGGMIGYQAASFIRTYAPGRNGLATPIVWSTSGDASRPFGDASIEPDDPGSVELAIQAILKRHGTERIASFAPGAFKGANVILIQVESLQEFVIGMSVDREEVTPRLTALAAESWYFPNAFSQAGPGTTSDAEFAANASLYPPSDEPASLAYADKRIPALPRLLGDIGYDTFTMHANTVRYWNRQELYPALGFSHYYDAEYFESDRIIGMGTSDHVMLRRALPEVVRQADEGPIYCQLVTLSPHHPFEMPDSAKRLELPQWLDGTIVGNYLHAMNYEDRQVGWFVQRLKQTGLWDSSIVVIYGDHGGLRSKDLKPAENRMRSELLLGHTYTSADRTNIPLLIHVPKQRIGVVSANAAGQIDLMPTVADALGLDISAVPHFGHSLFDYSRVLIAGRSGMPSRSFINNRVVGLAGATFDESTGVSLVTRAASKLTVDDKRDMDDARELLTLSDAYARALPARLDAHGSSRAVIPTRR